MKNLSRGLLAAACASALLASPASAADVTVRVEGAGGTSVPETRVTLPGPAVDKTAQGGTTCSAASAGSALEAATGGDWGGRADSQGQRVERIRNETHLLGDEYDGIYWAVYVNDRASSQGICQFEPQQGDELLIFPACGGATTGCYDGVPLDFDAPRIVRPGQGFEISVRETETTYGGPPDYQATTTTGPSQGATIGGGDAPATTNADGKATVVVSRRGEARLRASKGSRVPEDQTVCVTDGADGFCGTTTPSGETAPGQPAQTAAGAPARVPDRTSPLALITGVREGQVFSRARAPRVLRGQVGEPAGAARALRPDASGILMVKLRLTRTDRGRCSTFSGSRERFVRRPCGAAKGFWFRIGDRASWEYQLPSRLPRGRYVLDVNAVDREYNRDDKRKRGQNRVVFRVR